MLKTIAILAADASNADTANATFRERHPMALENLLGAVVFAVIGLVVFLLVFWLIVKVSPFSVRKEIEEDQNTSLAIIIGAVMIGIAIIIAAAINGG